MPREVCDAVEDAYRSGAVPINAAEGMIRQVIGWREFVWGISWLWPNQGNANVLGNRRSLPPSWSERAPTDLRCLRIALDGLHERGWVHHIQRLMVLSNFANLYGMRPQAGRDWMREQYVDGADWVSHGDPPTRPTELQGIVELAAERDLHTMPEWTELLSLIHI